MTKPMKRLEVERALRAHGCSPLPNHGEITAGVVASVQKQMQCLPEGWLQ